MYVAVFEVDGFVVDGKSAVMALFYVKCIFLLQLNLSIYEQVYSSDSISPSKEATLKNFSSSLQQIESCLQSIRPSSLQANKTTSETTSETFPLEFRNDSSSMPSHADQFDSIRNRRYPKQQSNSFQFNSTLYQRAGTESPMNE